ncbi:MAG: DUF1572 family protein [Ignavibacteriaceae bacterium]|nr:DUF1572 family protein [Ignavibacteriaceae bacterium]
MSNDYLNSAKKQFEDYKTLGDKTFAQLTDKEFFWQYNDDSNSIAIIVHHLWGNMLSRWTDFLTSDGEKEWRNRDSEFENNISNKAELMSKWNEGWKCLFDALNPLTNNDLSKTVSVRNQQLTVVEAINKQLTHYAYHIGQIVFIGKMLVGKDWKTLSVPKRNSVKQN